ncbi:hypothetical protein AAFC00_001083 [Neodothiora populina]|uniref:DUF6594 domain-containing protein n=1 Tax=Neodothiora populina TaxID=2781224 RepID=A0ABR3PMR0_9PEZI
MSPAKQTDKTDRKGRSSRLTTNAFSTAAKKLPKDARHGSSRKAQYATNSTIIFGGCSDTEHLTGHDTSDSVAHSEILTHLGINGPDEPSLASASAPKSDDNNATLTQASYYNLSNDIPSDDHENQVDKGSSGLQPLKASVKDDEQPSEHGVRNENPERQSASPTSSMGSALSPLNEWETPSSRLNEPFPDLQGHTASNPVTHKQSEVTDNHCGSAENGNISPQKILQGAKPRSFNSNEASREKEYTGEAYHAHSREDHASHRLQTQEEAVRNYILDPQYAQRPWNGGQVRASGLHGYSQQSEYQSRAIEGGVLALPPPSQHAFTASQIPPGQSPKAEVPEPPDLSRTTLAGYELLASQLTDAHSTIRPLYRRFETLHHRILLHIQDELCELEGNLRRFDEMIAQMRPRDEGGFPLPASRRAETHHGGELYQGRTQLLGQIFLKADQYHKAMSAYTSMVGSTEQASQEDIKHYRTWMAMNRPVHQTEGAFLDEGKDLVALPQRTKSSSRAAQLSIASLAFLPFLTLVAFTLVPTFLGRIVVTAAITGYSWMFVASNETRLPLRDHDWTIAIVAYLVLMTIIAGIVQ